MKVSVSGKQFVFPRSCACCGGYPLTTMSVVGSEKNPRSKTRGWAWDIPYCVACRRHIRAYGSIGSVALILGSVAVLAGFLRVVLTGDLIAALRMLLFLAVLGALACLLLFWYIARQSNPNCRGLGKSVLYLGSFGSFHSFEIRCLFYATDFARANRRKVVNASSFVASAIGRGDGHHSVPRRLTRW